MKTTVLQSDLAKCLGTVSRVIPSRGQLPVLANVLLEARKDGLTLVATNLELGIRVMVGGKIEEEGDITIPAKNLTEFVSSLPAGSVDLSTDGEKMLIKGGKLSATFTGISAMEFPVVPKIESVQGGRIVKIKRAMMEKVAKQVAFAAATDESRPVLTGVVFMSEGNILKITASDGFRLSRRFIEMERGLWLSDKRLILPARTLLEMSRIAAEGKKEEIEMAEIAENNQVIMAYDGIQLTSRILEGNFPDVEKIIPVDTRTKITLDRQEMLRAVKAVGIFARDSSNIIRLRIQDGGMMVEASATQTGESTVELEGEKTGDDGQIAFNYRFVLDFLNSVDSERVTFGMNDSLASGLFGIDGDNELLHLIMPVRV